MTGMFSGIIGSLIGAGIQSTVGGIQIRDDASKALDVLRRGGLPVPPANWFSQKSSDKQRSEQEYGNIEQHVTGVMQMLGPGMQIAKALADVAACSRSQPPAPAKDCMAQEEFLRSRAFCKPAEIKYDPMMLLSGPMATSSTRSVNNPIKKCCKPREHVYSESTKRIENKKIKKTAEKFGESSKNGANPLVTDEILGKGNGKKGKTDPLERDIKAEKFMTTAEISKNPKPRLTGRSSTVKQQSRMPKAQTKMFKSQNQFGKALCGKCLICQAQIREIEKSPMLLCGHTVCFKCLSRRKCFECPKCGY